MSNEDSDTDSSSGASSPDESDSESAKVGRKPSSLSVGLRRPSGESSGLQQGKNTAEAASKDRDDDELSIPRAALNKLIKELTPNVRVANDARELILNCCTEFIHLLSSEANDLCSKQQKKTISPEHIVGALNKLGFSCYKDDALAVLQEAMAVAAKKRRASSKLENLGVPEEELFRQQQELFAKARMQQEHIEQQEWLHMQEQLQQQQQQLQQQQSNTVNDDYD